MALKILITGNIRIFHILTTCCWMP